MWCYVTFLLAFPVLPIFDPRLTTVTERYLLSQGVEYIRSTDGGEGAEAS